eukprot:TRINITY_DN1125_c2_g2_i1.p1 TRINITY_DN1125_c2_g2~~TRINITY_DN1125_c2_g2_i1.p1  ORF type:complete len:478 (+),score=59.09 TRINITY_DN1125_c2_g2_i1:72-1505(+)
MRSRQRQTGRGRGLGGGPGVKSSVNNQRDARLWSAVALQQHLSQSLMAGITSRPTPHLAPVPAVERTPVRSGRQTLAQKMGLVPGLPPKMTDEDWQRVDGESRRRGDSARPCAICHEPFGLGEQVILSCSHVFHRDCMQAFERFQRSGKGSGIAACPLCRRKDYEKQAHTGGLDVCREVSVRTIQRVWRGHKGRMRHRDVKLEKDPVYRRDRQLAVVTGISDHELAAAQERESEIDQLFIKLDDERTAARTLDVDWEKARSQLLQRGLDNCAICLGSLLPDPTSKADDINARESVLLSCSHAFHAPCLFSFEEYERCAHATAQRCPVCRSLYATTPLFPTEGSLLIPEAPMPRLDTVVMEDLEVKRRKSVGFVEEPDRRRRIPSPPAAVRQKAATMARDAGRLPSVRAAAGVERALSWGPADSEMSSIVSNLMILPPARPRKGALVPAFFHRHADEAEEEEEETYWSPTRTTSGTQF